MLKALEYKLHDSEFETLLQGLQLCLGYTSRAGIITAAERGMNPADCMRPEWALRLVSLGRWLL